MAKRILPNAVIDLTLESDEESNNSGLGGVTRRLYSDDDATCKTKRVRRNSTPLEDDDEVQVVEAPIFSPLAAANPNVAGNADGELQVVGTRNELKLPHLRQHCTLHTFKRFGIENQFHVQNERHCELCYCYVCDAPAKDCKSWSGGGHWFNMHCNAHDKYNMWVAKREQSKKIATSGASKKGPGGRNPTAAIARPHSIRTPSAARNYSATHTSAARGSSHLPNAAGSSSAAREDRRASQLVTPGSSNRSTATANTSAVRGSSHLPNPSGPSSVAREEIRASQLVTGGSSDRSTAKANRKTSPAVTASSTPATNSTATASVSRGSNHGSKSTNASSNARRKTQEPVDFYFGERNIGFRILASSVRPDQQHSKAAIEKSIFDSKIKRSPTPRAILDLISEYDEDTHRKSGDGDAIILDNQDDVALLRILYRVNFRSARPGIRDFSYHDVYYLGDIAASWDKQTSSGTFKIRLTLPREFTFASHTSNNHALLLGCWFNVFPLNLHQICGTLEAHVPRYEYYLPTQEVRSAFEATISSHKEKVNESVSSLTLKTGCSNRDIGGYTSNDISLKGTLERYYRERFPHQNFANVFVNDSDDWNKISNHRSCYENADHDYVLSYSDRRIATLCLQNSARSVREDSTQNLLAHLENLGHEPELTCEGLSVELLEFQKQSLKWAMERETTSGGIQSYFWVKVPVKDFTLYFNPVLGRFREDKPKTVRGGIIAEEMGLGKTIISLALILKHPAPALPVSGSHISCLANTPSTAAGTESNVLQWDPDLHSQTSTDNKLRGSVLSRGTLVICPVSLVGQWIEEAKSKLSDPGLLYPYHGDKRTRNARILATKDIVVTTYQVLASDDNYHRNKSSNPDEYCPPLEQVRWWRIICDEGHSLRQGSTQRNRSLSHLVADNKWMVTGTPVSTSILDLKNQLQLIGIEDVDRMLRRQPIRHYGRCRRGDKAFENAPPGDLQFLLRNIMIRHTQKQVYRGTTTTLMSLPPKTERSIEVTLSDEERSEYDALDRAARDFYVQFKADNSRDMSKNYLVLSQKLTPQRVACAGGHPPLNTEAGDVEEDGNEGETKPQKKSEVKLSDFCFTSKLNNLIEELKRARDSDPSSKSLVFSHFYMTLDWLKKELPKHGFQFRTLSGKMSMAQRAKALHDFQSDPPTTIFLLSMRSGNCGINLTQANRVFLMEPGFNPALEKQAIGRVHRLGQKRPVEIIRLFVQDSIETRICKFLETKYGVPDNCSDGSNTDEKKSGSDEAGDNVLDVVGNLSSERPKNAMVTSEFDLLFGVESELEQADSPDVAMPDAAVSSDFL